jgi:hypothetical protein
VFSKEPGIEDKGESDSQAVMVPTRLSTTPMSPNAMSWMIYSILEAGSVEFPAACLFSAGADWMAWVVLVMESPMLERTLWMAVMAVAFSFRMLVCATFFSGRKY